MSITKKWTAMILVLVAILMALLIVRAAKADPADQYFSNSIIMDGTYDWSHATFSWQPSLMPGFSIDTSNIYCVGAVRADFNTFKCVEPYQWHYEGGKYYFVARLNMPTLCGNASTTLQPFLDVYSVAGAHDRIYGQIEAAPFNWCSKVLLPTIINKRRSK